MENAGDGIATNSTSEDGGEGPTLRCKVAWPTTRLERWVAEKAHWYAFLTLAIASIHCFPLVDVRSSLDTPCFDHLYKMFLDLLIDFLGAVNSQGV